MLLLKLHVQVIYKVELYYTIYYKKQSFLTHSGIPTVPRLPFLNSGSRTGLWKSFFGQRGDDQELHTTQTPGIILMYRH